MSVTVIAAVVSTIKADSAGFPLVVFAAVGSPVADDGVVVAAITADVVTVVRVVVRVDVEVGAAVVVLTVACRVVPVKGAGETVGAGAVVASGLGDTGGDDGFVGVVATVDERVVVSGGGVVVAAAVAGVVFCAVVVLAGRVVWTGARVPVMLPAAAVVVWLAGTASAAAAVVLAGLSAASAGKAAVVQNIRTNNKLVACRIRRCRLLRR